MKPSNFTTNVRVYSFLREVDALDDLQNRWLKVSLVGDMNDPFECWAMKAATREHRIALKLTAANLHARIGIPCFSRDWQETMMWSHYADKHRGICLGFDVPTEKLMPIAYVRRRLEFGVAARKIGSMGADPLLGTKYKGWIYEKEVRFPIPLAGQETGLVFSPLRHAKSFLFYPFGDDLRLRSVTVGVRSQLSRNRIKAALSNEDKGVALRKARLSFRMFGIVEQKKRDLW